MTKQAFLEKYGTVGYSLLFDRVIEFFDDSDKWNDRVLVDFVNDVKLVIQSVED